MTTVLVVSSTASLGMELRRQGLEVDQQRADLGPGEALLPFYEAALLDLTTAAPGAGAWLERLRADRADRPILLLGDPLQCERALPDAQDVLVAAPPLSAAELAGVIRRAVPAPPLVGAAAGETAGVGREPSITAAEALLPERLPPVEQGVPSPPVAPPPDPLPPGEPRIDPQPADTEAPPRRRRRSFWQARRSAPEPVSPRSPERLSTEVLAARLVERCEEIPPPVVLAEVLLGRAVARCRAQAAALLLRDPAGWVVLGGVGLRPLEYRACLTDDHWVIASTASVGVLLRIEDTDVARQRLVGLPLASRRHLLVAGIEDHAVLVVGRDGDPFSDDDAAAFSTTVLESGADLEGSVALRWLVRTLAPYGDLPPQAR